MNRVYAKRYREEHRDEINISAAKYRKKNRSRLRKEQKRYNHSPRAKKYDYRRAQTIKRRLLAVKCRAKKFGKKYNLTIEWAESLPLVCYYTGKPLTLEHHQPNTVSFERINNSMGYTKDNTVLCSYYINMAKKAMTEKAFIQMCEDIVNWQRENK